ncbi:MAG TPA: cytochrome C oxidase subunit IV family protein [Gemmatales bacterium]|nr:cytochrome C oxidase subunit IV family protein [Gemmatales bacterium]HMP59711.1 cytochrome C oxidase subunit IV family protein [Gemmatales bacterium]
MTEKLASAAAGVGQADSHGGEHHGDMDAIYYKVFGALVVCTAVSFITVSPLWFLGATTGHTLVMLVAVVKALLVAMFFMHLKYDWNKLYFMFVPTLTIATLLPCVLLPDITFSQTRIIHFSKDANAGTVPPPAAQVLE